MQALRFRKTITEGKLLVEIPKEFGDEVEVIVLPVSESGTGFWSEEELKNFGKTSGLVAGLDREDYSQW